MNESGLALFSVGLGTSFNPWGNYYFKLKKKNKTQLEFFKRCSGDPRASILGIYLKIIAIFFYSDSSPCSYRNEFIFAIFCRS